MLKHIQTTFKTLLLAAGISGLTLTSATANAEHFVSVSKAEAVTKPLSLKFRASVDEKLDSSPASAIHSYRLTVDVPKNVNPAISRGDLINVLLPIVRNRSVKAHVLRVDGTKIRLLLTNQVQQLEGQTLTAEIPLKKDGLYLLRSESVYAPRGLAPQVFVLADNNTVKTLHVDVLQVWDSGRILVSSAQLTNSDVIFRGLDNLISGDTVQVIPSEEVKHD